MPLWLLRSFHDDSHAMSWNGCSRCYSNLSRRCAFSRRIRVRQDGWCTFARYSMNCQIEVCQQPRARKWILFWLIFCTLRMGLTLNNSCKERIFLVPLTCGKSLLSIRPAFLIDSKAFSETRLTGYAQQWHLMGAMRQRCLALRQPYHSVFWLCYASEQA